MKCRSKSRDGFRITGVIVGRRLRLFRPTRCSFVGILSEGASGFFDLRVAALSECCRKAPPAFSTYALQPYRNDVGRRLRLFRPTRCSLVWILSEGASSFFDLRVAALSECCRKAPPAFSTYALQPCLDTVGRRLRLFRPTRCSLIGMMSEGAFGFSDLRVAISIIARNQCLLGRGGRLHLSALPVPTFASRLLLSS
jgi:hypothetical protein